MASTCRLQLPIEPTGCCGLAGATKFVIGIVALEARAASLVWQKRHHNGCNANAVISSCLSFCCGTWSLVMPRYAERAVRIEANELCTIAREDGRLISGMLLDLSDEGFCVESIHRLDVGERIEIRVRGMGRVAGIVRWFDCCRAGGVLEPYSRGACEPM